MVPLEPIANVPMIDLNDDNEESIVSTAKSLGYFLIPRSSPFGQIPDDHSLEMMADELFHQSMDEKLTLGSNYIRSVNFGEPPVKKESIAFTKTNQIVHVPRSIAIKSLFNLCQQISAYLSEMFQISSDPSACLPSNKILFNHYEQLDEPSVKTQDESTLFQFHLYSSVSIEQLDSVEHQWKPIQQPFNSGEYILVTLPNFSFRYPSADSAIFTIDYQSHQISEYLGERTYWLSLRQNKSLRYVTFFYLYVMQGVPAGFSSTALANYLTAEGEQSSTVGTFVSLSGLPWALQFVWGPLIDRFQSSPMGRRRPWVIGSQICAFLASLGLLFVRDPPTKYIKTLVVAFFIHSIFASIQDASVDAQAITTISLNERGRINGFMRGGFLVGSALGAAGLSWILRNRSYLTAAMLNSLILLIFTIFTFFIKEKSDDHLFPCYRARGKSSQGKRRSYKTVHDYSLPRLFLELFKGLLSRQSLRLFIPILVVYACQAAFIRAYNIHLIKELGWSDTSVSILSGAWGTLLVVGVALMGGWLADRIGARRLLLIVIFIHASYMLTANLLEPFWHKRSVATAVLILWNMMDPILSTAAMPVLMSLCRTHVEGSQFTTYMSMVNLCDLAGAFISGQIQRHFRANIIGLACAVLIIFAFIVVSVGVWYDRHQSSTNETSTTTTTTLDQVNLRKRKSLRNCWPACFFPKYKRGSFKVVV